MSAIKPKCFRLDCTGPVKFLVPVMQGVSIRCCNAHLEVAKATAQSGRRQPK